MEPIEFIVSYIRTKATLTERQQIKDVMEGFKSPPIDTNVVLSNLLTNCRSKWLGGDGRLNIVKYVKEITCWGLKDCKDWADANIFTIHRVEPSQF